MAVRDKGFGGRWRYVIEGETARNFRNTYDTKETIALLEEVKTIFKTKKEQKQVEHYIERFKAISEMRDEDYDLFEKKHNHLLNFVWDFFDNHDIFINFC